MDSEKAIQALNSDQAIRYRARAKGLQLFNSERYRSVKSIEWRPSFFCTRSATHRL